MSIRVKAAAAVLAVGGLGLGLLGSGVHAAFTSGGSATENIKVGSFGIAVTSAQGTVVGNTVTFNAPDIQSSAPGSAPFAFTVTSTGTIPAVIHIVATVPAVPFADLLGAPADLTLNTATPAHTYNGGLSWTALDSTSPANTSITYTITATG